MTRNSGQELRPGTCPVASPALVQPLRDVGGVPDGGLQIRVQAPSARVYAGSLEFAADTSLFQDYFASGSKNP